MAYPETLTANQQTTLLNFMTSLRPNLLLFSKLINNLALLDNVWNGGGVKAINALLQAADVIPDNTGLSGATPLTAADLNTAMTAIEGFLTSYNTAGYQAYFVRAVGAANAATLT